MNNKIWFTSDTHFGSQRTLELSKRPFKTVKGMDEAIIDNWNSVVSKDDIIYHLGDFGDYERVKELNGNITLICGNYEIDDIGNNFNCDYKKFMDHILDLGFNDIYINEHHIWIRDNSHRINMVHEPSKIPQTLKDNEYNLFGHIHGLQRIKKRGLNVGVDAHNYYPIGMDTVEFYHNAIRNFYDEDVFI
jgi:calcineurin-like phosphoesterase family protein